MTGTATLPRRARGIRHQHETDGGPCLQGMTCDTCGFSLELPTITARGPESTIITGVPCDDPASDHGTAHTVVAYRSGNAKTGPIPTTARGQSTCPVDCPLMGSGCYGENRNGRPSIFDMVGKSETRRTVRSIALRHWHKMPPAVRFNVVGDYLQADGTPDLAYISDTNFVASGRPWIAWSYSHAWRQLSPDLFSYVVRASVQTREEAEEALAAGWEVALVDPGPEAPDTLIGATIGGRRVVQCPVTSGRAAACVDCRLCGRAGSAIVAFPVHGSARRRAAVAVRADRATTAAAAVDYAERSDPRPDANDIGTDTFERETGIARALGLRK